MKIENLREEFEKVKQRADTIAREEPRLEHLIREATEKARRHRDELQKLWSNLQWLLRMLDAYRRGHYREVPWRVILYAAAAILYFLNPMDLVPDFLTGIGFVDDATVLALVVKAIHDELERFKQWYTRQSTAARKPTD
ncbi:MAG: DUF1232 domain-containing protein [Calditrichaeota bacterium]|nr:DUF1232 domain-containing protein [Calditrichota bacterium]